jgi:hypothetical protein
VPPPMGPPPSLPTWPTSSPYYSTSTTSHCLPQLGPSSSLSCNLPKPGAKTTVWTITSSFLSPSVQIVTEVDIFHYLGTTLDSRVTLDQFCTLILQRIWHSHHMLVALTPYARGRSQTCSRSPLHNCPTTTIYNLWRASVAVHALMHLVPLHTPGHLTHLQTALNQSLGYTFLFSVTAVPYVCIDSGFPPPTSRPE